MTSFEEFPYSQKKEIDLESAREQFRYQEIKAFSEQEVSGQDENRERSEATEQEKEQIDENFKKLGNIFQDSEVNWQLDGAPNISFMKGEYIGKHKDVDITVDSNDLEKFEQQLFSRGYGLFLSSKIEDSNQKKMEWISAHELQEAPQEDVMMVAIDEQGQINEKEKFNFVDVHLIERDEQGNPLGFSGVTLPEKWYEPQPITFQNETINLSHPAKVVYFKLHDQRGFDQTDLYSLAETGKLTKDDIGEIEEVIEQEFENKKTAVSNIVERIAPNIKPNSNTEDIFNMFMEDNEVLSRVKPEKKEDRELVFGLVKIVSEQDDKSSDNLKRSILKAMEVEFTQKREKLKDLRDKIE